MTSLLFIGNPPQTLGGIIQVTGGSAAIHGGIKIFRGGIISGQVRGIAGGSEKSSAGVGGLVKIPLDCTVHLCTLGQKKLVIIRFSSQFLKNLGWVTGWILFFILGYSLRLFLMLIFFFQRIQEFPSTWLTCFIQKYHLIDLKRGDNWILIVNF